MDELSGVATRDSLIKSVCSRFAGGDGIDDKNETGIESCIVERMRVRRGPHPETFEAFEDRLEPNLEVRVISNVLDCQATNKFHIHHKIEIDFIEKCLAPKEFFVQRKLRQSAEVAQLGQLEC